MTDEKLYLANYEDLTMAAQFEDSSLPAKHNAGLVIKLTNGLYNITVRQLFDPEDEDYEPNGKVNFELAIQQADKPGKITDSIFWYTEQ